MKANAVFILITLGLAQLIKNLGWLHSDEAWLTAAFTALLVSYWVQPRPKQKYFIWTGTGMLLGLGAYLFALKLPRLFGDSVNYRLLSLLCFLLYVVGCWAFSRWRIGNQQIVRNKHSGSVDETN